MPATENSEFCIAAPQTAVATKITTGKLFLAFVIEQYALAAAHLPITNLS